MKRRTGLANTPWRSADGATEPWSSSPTTLTSVRRRPWPAGRPRRVNGSSRADHLQTQVFNGEAGAESTVGALSMAEADGRLPVDADVVIERQVLVPDPGVRPRARQHNTERSTGCVAMCVGEPSRERLEDGRRRENSLGLITTVDAEDLDAQALLDECKFQTAVELRFKFLKDRVPC